MPVRKALKPNGGFSTGSAVKNEAAMQEGCGFDPQVWMITPGGGNGNPLQYSCLGNPHGCRSLADYSPWGHKESDMTEQLSLSKAKRATETRRQ